MPTLADARALLQRHFGYAAFRPAQARVVRSVLAGRDTLAVLPTGAGKSVCFQIPALALNRLTVVVSPLVALMQDQVAAARARGIPAAALHSALEAAEREEVARELRAGTLRLVYVSPERLPRLADALVAAGVRPALLAVDEAHCISEWGHDFRPAFRRIGAVRTRLGRPPALAVTGSATPAVRDDIVRTVRLGRGGPPDVHVASFDRPNLWFGVRRVRDEAERLAALRGLLAERDALAIVYAPTRNVTETLARVLREAGHRAAPYHAGMGTALRRQVLSAFLADELDAVVATCAFGMGIDKPDVRLVIHWTAPPTPEAYYQEAGRAGRDGRLARCVLLARRGDGAMHRRLLDVTFPDPKLVERLWRTPAELARAPRPLRETVERLRQELRPGHGPVSWTAVRARRRAALERIAAVEAYAAGRGCRRRALLGYFGERLEACAGCDRCRPARPAPLADPAARIRLARLAEALAGRRGAWGGALLDPVVQWRLAVRPPAGAAELADVPGVGPELAERLGGTILAALGAGPAAAAVPRGAAAGTGEAGAPDPLLARLTAWRDRIAHEGGLPPWLICTDAGLARLARERPGDRAGLRVAGGLGPRGLARWGDELLRLLHPAVGPAGPAGGAAKPAGEGGACIFPPHPFSTPREQAHGRRPLFHGAASSGARDGA